ncbi:MAG: Spx/MgsR family RNA polymerase-binding regulatory protein [Erysipelotrichaceae bacterium]
MLFVCYNKCSTCQKAKKYLEEKGLDFQFRDIKEDRLTYDELKMVQQLSGLPVNKLFNSSGKLYKEYHLKEKLKEISEEEKFNLLAGDGMLVKRPILIGENFALVGFNREQWDYTLER